MPLVPPALLVLAGCGFSAAGGGWRQQLDPGGPCYAVNLLDGLDEADTAELHQLFDCLDRSGGFDPLAGLVDALDSPDRDGRPAGTDLAAAFNRLPEAGVRAAWLLGTLSDWLGSGGAPLDALSHAWVELLYGRSYPELQAGQVELLAASSLDGGVVRPAIRAAELVAGADLDGGLAGVGLAGQALASSDTLSLLHTTAGLLQGPDAQVAARVEALPADLGDAVDRARSPGNDTWTGASGDSVRDLLAALLEPEDDGLSRAEHLAQPAALLLADPALEARLRAAVASLEAGGHLPPLPSQLIGLASEDTWGAPLQPGGTSALAALLRLLDEADTPVHCSLDVWVTTIDVDLPNLSESILEALARPDRDAAVSGVGLFGTIIDWSISDAILYEIADSGVCPAIDRRFVDDLHAVDRLDDPAEGDLLEVLIEGLAAFDHPTDGRIPELVDLLGGLHALGLVEPAQELLRDAGSAPLAQDLVGLVPVLLEPSDYLDQDAMPAGVRPFDLEAAWRVAGALVQPRDDGTTPLQVMVPLARAAAGPDGTWDALANLAALVQQGDAVTGDVRSLLLPLLALDPSLEATRTLAAPLVDPAIAGPLERVIETPQVGEALARAELGDEGPLPFTARLVLDGTLDAALRLARNLLALLGG